MASPRRVGAETSKTRYLLLDCVERLMLETGYAGVTYRALAAKAGVTAGLVQYYFPTLDDLFVAAIRRRSEQNLERLAEALRTNAGPAATRAVGVQPRRVDVGAHDRVLGTRQPPQVDSIGDHRGDRAGSSPPARRARSDVRQERRCRHREAVAERAVVRVDRDPETDPARSGRRHLVRTCRRRGGVRAIPRVGGAIRPCRPTQALCGTFEEAARIERRLAADIDANGRIARCCTIVWGQTSTEERVESCRSRDRRSVRAGAVDLRAPRRARPTGGGPRPGCRRRQEGG